MNVFTLVFFLLLPNGDVQTRAVEQSFVGADQCLTVKEQLEATLQSRKAMGTINGWTATCVDSGLTGGVAL